MALTDDMLVIERHAGISGTQRLYRLPNGYGLSLVNGPMLHAYPFAWEAAVLESGAFEGLTYDMPLTDDVEVFSTDDEANAFIARAKAWAESK